MPDVPGRRPVAALVLLTALALVAASAFGYFRAEDWLGLELGARALEQWRVVLTTLWHDAFYRPVTDLYLGVMVRVSPREPWPHLATLILLFALEAWLLARIARLRGADPTTAWIVAAAAWAQVNAYAWSTLWMSNAGGSLATGFMLAAIWMHHRATRGGGRPWPTWIGLAAATTLAVLSKEDAVMLPGILLALELARASRLTPPERRRSLAAGLVVAGLVAVYLAFRLTVMPTPQVAGQHYNLRFGANSLRNLSVFLLHLGALPLAVLALTRLLYPAAWSAEARRDPSWPRARGEIVAGLAWAAVAIQIYLPIGGFAYGYLHGPAMGIALAAGSGLAWAWRASAASRHRVSPALPLGLHWAAMALVVAWALTLAGWPRYRTLAREAFAVLDRAMPAPPESARVVFLDPSRAETITGRSLFNMMFDGLPQSVLRFHYRRADLRGEYVRGAEAQEALGRYPEADLVVLAEQGRLRVVRRGPRLGPGRGGEPPR